jgi:hypothetical protein
MSGGQALAKCSAERAFPMKLIFVPVEFHGRRALASLSSAAHDIRSVHGGGVECSYLWSIACVTGYVYRTAHAAGE